MDAKKADQIKALLERCLETYASWKEAEKACQVTDAARSRLHEARTDLGRQLAKALGTEEIGAPSRVLVLGSKVVTVGSQSFTVTDAEVVT